MTVFNELIGETDAQKWAREFVKVAELRPDIPTDEGTMIGWFANAIMAGHDEGRRLERSRGFHELIREIAYQAAGAGSGQVMMEAPHVVMPSEEISKRVDQILSDFGIESEWRDDARGDSGWVGSGDKSPRASSTPCPGRSPNVNREAMGLKAQPDGLLREHKSMEPE